MEEITANIIAENIISYVESEGHHYQVLTGVNDHKIDNSAVTNVDDFIKYRNGNLQQKRTNIIWKLLVEWKDVSVDWVLLNNLKKYSLVELDGYSMKNETSE